MSNSSVRLVEVSEEDQGQRLDNFLVRHLKGVPKNRIYKLLRKGEFRVNKGRKKPDYRVQDGDVVRIPPIRVSEGRQASPGGSVIEIVKRSIIFEDESIMVVNKPSGLAVHGGSGLNYGLIEALRAVYPNAPFLELVHRIDRDTSGCVMVAKKRSRLREIHGLMRESKLDKYYQLLVCGQWDKSNIKVDASLEKFTIQGGERMVKVSKDGKSSLTIFKILQEFEYATLLEADLKTGRTHQIRVHTKHCGNPIAGDDKYGDREENKEFRDFGLKRLFLHAAKLRFVMPSSGKEYVVEAPLPQDLQEVVNRLSSNRLNSNKGQNQNEV
ncbi:MAG: 23S rRNA pseudouridine(955/2504/2580) synthase RluC [Gammaproteobacteria bacterium]|nr:MAG: 23S rRNA pseudouridine(955/2504/2580) synthase RluC [Gammaproteobacteria bacterium]